MDEREMIDQGCVKPLGTPPLGIHTALSGERLVLSGTSQDEDTPLHRSVLGGKTPLLFTRSHI